VKLQIPKDMRGVGMPRVFSVELNDFDIDLFLPVLFYRVLADGRARARRANEPTAVARYVDALAKHFSLEGFDNPEGRRVLDRLVRTSLVTMGRTGAASGGREQILSIEPYTALAHKAGFPVETTRLRRADVFIYRVLRDSLSSADNLHRFMADVFGRGVIFGKFPSLGGAYDGHTELDTLTRLSLAFLDGFENTPVGNKRDAAASPLACPAHAVALGEDLLRYLFAFHDRMPAQALTYYLLGLLNVELFSYSLTLVHAVNALVRDPSTLPPAMRVPFAPAPPQIYLDFTDRAGGLSREMATACVRRDIEAYQQFLGSVLLLRQLDGYVNRLRRTRAAEVETLVPADATGPEYLQGLLLVHDDSRLGPAIAAMAGVDEDRIREENKPGGKGEDDEDGDEEGNLAWLDVVASAGKTEAWRVVALLVEGQQGQALRRYMAWYRGIGGLTKPHGILAGDVRGRRAWRYAPSNDFLSILVQLAAVHGASANSPSAASSRGPAAIGLPDFLRFLEHRFGILIDRPPAPYAGADAAAAARDNLRAMLGRLRQMGMFRDLSDDFTVQRLFPPFADERASYREA